MYVSVAYTKSVDDGESAGLHTFILMRIGGQYQIFQTSFHPQGKSGIETYGKTWGKAVAFKTFSKHTAMLDSLWAFLKGYEPFFEELGLKYDPNQIELCVLK